MTDDEKNEAAAEASQQEWQQEKNEAARRDRALREIENGSNLYKRQRDASRRAAQAPVTDEADRVFREIEGAAASESLQQSSVEDALDYLNIAHDLLQTRGFDEHGEEPLWLVRLRGAINLLEGEKVIWSGGYAARCGSMRISIVCPLRSPDLYLGVVFDEAGKILHHESSESAQSLRGSLTECAERTVKSL